jgi:dTMP kinase
MRGKFIVLEGADGSGTTSQAMELHRYMSQWTDVHLTAEPSDLAIGQFIRRVLAKDLTVKSRKAIEFLFRADRLDHIEQEIRPKLEAGVSVICDRYYPSTLVYQSAGVSESVYYLASLCEKMFSVEEGEMLLRPDSIILLGVSLDESVARRERRGGREELFEAREFQKKVIQLYDKWMQFDVYHENKCWVNGEQSMEAVQADVRLVVDHLFGREKPVV